MSTVTDRLFELARLYLRPRSVPALLLGVGAMFMIAAAIEGVWDLILGGLIGLLPSPTDTSTPAGEGPPLGWLLPTLRGALFVAGLVIVCLSIRMMVVDRRIDRVRADKRHDLAIEIRGLRQIPGSPLADHLARDVVMPRDISVDLREALYDGDITHPDRALQKLLTLPDRIVQTVGQRAATDVSITVGAMAPVPFTFLAGILLDDERRIQFMDWDRYEQRWRELDADDDGERFTIDPLPEITSGTSVALCVSGSYRIDIEGVRKTLPRAAIVEMRMNSFSTDGHWSLVKQQALGRQFMDMLLNLSASGVGEIDLFLAASSSLILRLGSLYDRRNLPPVRVYQYERSGSPPFPWAIRMPVSGSREAEVHRPLAA